MPLLQTNSINEAKSKLDYIVCANGIKISLQNFRNHCVSKIVFTFVPNITNQTHFFMKTTLRLSLVTLSIFAFTSLTHAQLYVGGSLGFNSTASSSTVGTTTTKGTSTSSLTLSPEVGYFLSESFAVGLGVSFNSNTTTTPITTTTSTVGNNSTFMINPYARYFFYKSGNFSAFAEGSVGYGSMMSETTVGSNTTKNPSTSIISVGIAPGIAYDLSDKFSLIAKLGNIGFQSSTVTTTNTIGTTTTTSTSNMSNFGLNVGLSGFTFGAIFKL